LHDQRDFIDIHGGYAPRNLERLGAARLPDFSLWPTAGRGWRPLIRAEPNDGSTGAGGRSDGLALGQARGFAAVLQVCVPAQSGWPAFVADLAF